MQLISKVGTTRTNTSYTLRVHYLAGFERLYGVF